MTLAAVWTFLKKVPGWVWLVIIGALAGFVYVQGEKSRVRKEVNDERDKEGAEVESEVITQITEHSNEYVRQSDAVRSLDVAEQLPEQRGATLPEAHYRD